MKYIITNGEKYLKQGIDMRYSVVDTPDEASMWKVREKAINVTKFCPLCKIHNLEVIESDTDNIEDEPFEYDIEQEVNRISNFVNKLQDRRALLLKLIHKEELKICDIEHAAEFQNPGAAAGYKIYKILHDCRCKRRDYKDELMQIENILKATLNVDGMKTLNKAIRNMDKRKYAPRILIELFQ